MERPVVRLELALYGHPDSGTFWEGNVTLIADPLDLNRFLTGRRAIFMGLGHFVRDLCR